MLIRSYKANYENYIYHVVQKVSDFLSLVQIHKVMAIVSAELAYDTFSTMPDSFSTALGIRWLVIRVQHRKHSYRRIANFSTMAVRIEKRYCTQFIRSWAILKSEIFVKLSRHLWKMQLDPRQKRVVQPVQR